MKERQFKEPRNGKKTERHTSYIPSNEDRWQGFCDVVVYFLPANLVQLWKPLVSGDEGLCPVSCLADGVCEERLGWCVCVCHV
jgi:hypothetical protein